LHCLVDSPGRGRRRPCLFALSPKARPTDKKDTALWCDARTRRHTRLDKKLTHRDRVMIRSRHERELAEALNAALKLHRIFYAWGNVTLQEKIQEVIEILRGGVSQTHR
jgi:hypothetical protein